MKKSIAMAAAVVMSFSALSITAAADDVTKVYVTISDNNNKLVLTEEPIEVTDIDSDGKLTINDALYIAHEKFYEGGAAAGYKSSVGQWGLGLDKLWGVENGGSYGYYVNHIAANGLADIIANGAMLDAYTFPDPKNLDYYYSFFSLRNNADQDPGYEMENSLSYISFDSNWAPVTKPVAGAKITVNGKDTGVVTDENGSFKVTLTEPGKNVVSAVSDTVNIAPPSYVVNINGEAATTSTTTKTTTTTTETTTTTTETTTAKTTAKTTKSTTKSTAKATTAKNNSPKTGDTGAGVTVFALGAAVAVAFAFRRKDEE